MSTEVLLRKVANVGFAPADENEAEKLTRFKTGGVVRAKFTQMRNYEFHKKYFAMVKIAFDAWADTVPRQEYKGEPVSPNIERFRRDLQIMAGFYKPVYSAKGDVRLESDSISFANMDQAEFEKVYSKVVDVVLEKILTNYQREDLDRVVNELMGFM